MSQPSQNAAGAASLPSPFSPDFPEYAVLAAKLQETAQALLALGRVALSDGDGGGGDGEGDASASEERPAEVRSYRLSDIAVKEERAMLQAYDARNWQELLDIACDRLHTTTKLMRCFESDEDIDAFFLNQIAENLLLPSLDMLDRLCSLLADFRLQPEDARTGASCSLGNPS